MKVLFVLGSYTPKPSANGICVKNIISEFLKNKYEVHCLCFGDCKKYEDFFEGDVQVHTVKMTFRTKMRELYNKNGKKFFLYISRMISALNYISYPIRNIFLSRRFCIKTLDLHKKNNFDIVISVFQPSESLYAGLKLKKKYKNVIWVSYFLDSLANVYNKKNALNLLLTRRAILFEEKVYKNSNLIINMFSQQKFCQKTYKNKYSHKIVFSDIPMIIPETYKLLKNKKKVNSNGIFSFIYAGSLNLKLRNPKYICELFTKMFQLQKNVMLDFYSSGDCEELIKYYQRKSCSKIKAHGIVSHEEIIEKIKYQDNWSKIIQHCENITNLFF